MLRNTGSRQIKCRDCSKKVSSKWSLISRLTKRSKSKCHLLSHPSRSLAYPKTRPHLNLIKLRVKAQKREIWNNSTKIMESTIPTKTQNLLKKSKRLQSNKEPCQHSLTSQTLATSVSIRGRNSNRLSKLKTMLRVGWPKWLI